MSDKLLLEVTNELKKYIMYICDFGMYIDGRIVLNFTQLNLDFKGHFGQNSKSCQ